MPRVCDAYDWTPIVRGEFQEMPGLRLTRAQAQRLWGFDAGTCDVVMRTLLEAGFLMRLPDGKFARADQFRAA
jgi:hypothetical protein